MFLKQSTTVNLKLGPFVDKTDGYTPKTGLTPAVKLSKNGAAMAARHSATAVAHDADGYYTVELDTTDTNTVGLLRVMATDAANNRPVVADFWILPAKSYDRLFAGETIADEVHMTKARTCNKTTFDLATQTLVVKDDDNATTLRTIGPASLAGTTRTVPVS